MSETLKEKIIQSKIELIEVGVAFLLMMSIWLGYISAKELIVNVLLFIVFIELARMVGHFLFNGKVLKLRYLIDGTIAFLLRELVIAISDHHLKINDRIIEISIIIGTLCFLFIFRYASVKFGPKRKEKQN